MKYSIIPLIKVLMRLLLVAAAPLAACAQQPKLIGQIERKGNDLVIAYQKYVLANGLTLILTQDHSNPIVYVDVSYHVGSAREQIGKSGFAHFFEHMMFEGSEHVKGGEHVKIITAAGGTLNGTTDKDYTHYYETVPSNELEKVLWLESDRMGFLAGALTQEGFEIQRATIKNERAQNYDNQPYGLETEIADKALFAYGHPYSWPTIGHMEDLDSGSLDDLRRFFVRWYGPNNATLTIGGDFDTKQLLIWVQKYFGPLPPAVPVKKIKVAPTTLKANRYISYTDNYADQPKLYIVFPGVPQYDKDQAALDCFWHIFAQGRKSILYKNFIASGKAVGAEMSSSNDELAGEINFQLTPYAGQSLQDMKALLDSSFIEFEQTGVSDDDLKRFKSGAETSRMGLLSSISGKVDELALSQIFTNNPNQSGKELAAINALTTTDIMRVYHSYLKNKPAVLLSILTKNSNIKALAPDNYAPDPSGYTPPDYGYNTLSYHHTKDSFNRNIMPKAGKVPEIKVPVIWKASLANGVKIIGTTTSEMPIVRINISINAQVLNAHDSSKAGLPGLTALMMGDATKHYSNEQFGDQLDQLGSKITLSSMDESIIISVSSLTKNLDQTLALLQERLLRPMFTQQALERRKKQRIQSLEALKTQPTAIAYRVFKKLLYGNNNLRINGFTGSEKTITNISLADVQNYYQHHFTPKQTDISIVGDISSSQMLKKLAFFKNWENQRAADSTPSLKSLPPKKNTVYLINIPHAVQSEIRIGYATPLPFDATGVYYRLGIVNYALGGSFSGRLNADLRQKKGWTYNAVSAFSSTKDAGTFIISTAIRTDVTDSAVAEIKNILQVYADSGITAQELTFTKNAIEQADALNYETSNQKADYLRQVLYYGLDENFIKEQRHTLSAITLAEINTLAKKYLQPSAMTILIVGDRQSIAPELIKQGYRLIELDTSGNIKQ